MLWGTTALMLIGLISPPIETDEFLSVIGERLDSPFDRDRPVTHVSRKDLDEQVVRTMPEALRFAPGVTVQQSGHGQASPYIRGRTGQHVLLLFDGLRLNHALFRQGPNQYLFTVDPHTIDSIDVVRGSASVEVGADAVTGVVLIKPLEPRIDPTSEGFSLRALAGAWHATQADELAGRLQLDAQLGRRTGLLVGIDAASVDRLESAGSVGHLLDQDDIAVSLSQKQVPTFEENGRTMLGTGYGVWAGDARLVHRFTEDDSVTLAAYVFRQSDAPRTDQCPPPEAPLTECLKFEQQNRTHVYGKTALSPGWLLLDHVKAAFGFQRGFERRALDRSQTIGAFIGGDDSIDVWGAQLVGGTRAIDLGGRLRLVGRFGADGTDEAVASDAFIELTRINVRRDYPRGRWVDGSRYQQGGVWASPRVEWWSAAGPGARPLVSLRVGGRLAGAAARVDAVPDADTRGLDRTWTAAVANAGLEVRPLAPLTVLLTVEQGFRPPNLDDLSGREATGRGYQVENPDLVPEEGVTYEAGLRLSLGLIRLSGYVHLEHLEHLMERRRAECPESDRECGASRAAVQLVNTDGIAEIRGLEGLLELRPWHGLRGEAAVTWTEGESDSPVPDRAGQREPITRIPPLNGHVQLTWAHADTGLYVGGALRWAADQTALSFGDTEDARIPFGGTPGYQVYDARAGLRHRDFQLSFLFENLTDAPYRIHGSSINGPARGVAMSLKVHSDVL